MWVEFSIPTYRIRIPQFVTANMFPGNSTIFGSIRYVLVLKIPISYLLRLLKVLTREASSEYQALIP